MIFIQVICVLLSINYLIANSDIDIFDDDCDQSEVDENNNIDQISGITPEIIFLNSIIFFNTNKWSIWINDELLSNESSSNEYLDIVNVNNDCVKIKLKIINQDVVLRSNTSFNTKNSTIKNGDLRINLKSQK